MPDKKRFVELIAFFALLRSPVVVRFRFWFVTAVALIAILSVVLRAQVSDEEKRKREIFLKSHSASSNEKSESPSPTPKHKSTKKKATPKPKSTKRKSTAKKSPTPKSKRKTRRETAKPVKTPTPREMESSRASPTPIERPTARFPRAIPVRPDERAQVVVEKSGLEDQGLAPTPSPPRRSGFWPWSRSSSVGYRYLTRSVSEEIDRAPVQRGRWQYIVVHNSGTRQGNARVFDYYHRHVRQMRNGLAYHFVIGNGTSTRRRSDRNRRSLAAPDQRRPRAQRLPEQHLARHLPGRRFQSRPADPGAARMCEELIRYLRQRCGKVDDHDIHRRTPPRK